MHINTKRRLGALLGLVLALAFLTPAVAAPAAGSDGGNPVASISVVGAATEGRTFRAFRIARYAHVSLDDADRPVGVVLETTSAAFRAALGPEVARIEKARTGTAPAVTPEGMIDGVDPLQWVALNWPQDPAKGDLWGNPGSTTGPLRDLADWLGLAVQADPDNFGLTEEAETGSRSSDGTAKATFGALPAGLYILTQPPSASGAPTTGTRSRTMVVGTQIPVGGTLRDLYGIDGSVRRVLGLVNVKGDAVTVTKTIAGDATGFAGGEAVMMVIETALPRFDLFDPSAPVRFEITDSHSSGLGEPDWLGVDARVPDPVLTVGATTLRYDVGCDVGIVNVSEPCFGVVSTGSTTGVSTGSTIGGGSTTGSWTVVLPDWVARAHGGEAVFLTFEQLLAPGASSAAGNGLAPSRDTNRADVTFSHDPARPEATTTTGGAEVAAFTFPLRLTKVDATSGKPLAGVGFEVTTGEVAHCFAPDDDGTYWHAGTAPCSDGTTAQLTTSPDGTLSVHGLAGNTAYTVVETKQPTGYSPSNLQVVRFTATANATLTDDGLHLAEVDHTFTNAGTARSLGTFLTTSTATTTVPTSTGNESRTLTTGDVTVKNWVKGPHAATGGLLRTLGADPRTAVMALGLLAASGVLLAVAARQRRRQTGPAPSPTAGSPPVTATGTTP